jgi:hypothetical protein
MQIYVINILTNVNEKRGDTENRNEKRGRDILNVLKILELHIIE